MASIIVASDVHGMTIWKKFAVLKKPEDRMIFLGDYFDLRGRGPHANSQVNNFLEICNFARSAPNTWMLVGNHDYHYLPFAPWQNFLEPAAKQFQRALMDNLDLLDMIHITGIVGKPTIFAHGGLTETFMRLHDIAAPSGINDFWRDHPGEFGWRKSDPETGAPSERHGDNPWQPPTWVRTTSLVADAPAGYDQVVGHTPVEKPAYLETAHGDTILFTCTLDETPVILSC